VKCQRSRRGRGELLMSKQRNLGEKRVVEVSFPFLALSFESLTHERVLLQASRSLTTKYRLAIRQWRRLGNPYRSQRRMNLRFSQSRQNRELSSILKTASRLEAHRLLELNSQVLADLPGSSSRTDFLNLLATYQSSYVLSSTSSLR